MVKVKGARDYDIKKSADASSTVTNMFKTQPVQFLLKNEKDEDWACLNMDWLEWYGIKQLRARSPQMLKNYKLIEGIIDTYDYTVGGDNPNSDLVSAFKDDDYKAAEIKNYPLVPRIVNTILTEFAQRNDSVVYFSTDDASHNEILEAKRELVEKKLLQEAFGKLRLQILNQNPDISEDQLNEMLGKITNDNLKSLPEIENFFKRDYKTIFEQWATKLHKVDTERFRFHELEYSAFRDLMASSREFWHLKMMEDDYKVELWNPMYTFYYKQPNDKFISNASFVGKMELMTISEVMSNFGFLMSEEDFQSLADAYPAINTSFVPGGYPNQGEYYDTHNLELNKVDTGGSLGFKKLMAIGEFINPVSDILFYLIQDTEAVGDRQLYTYLRATTAYWKSYKKIGVLTKIDDGGNKFSTLVEDNYVSKVPPVYNNTLIKEKETYNLIYGEHIDWIWIPEVWGGIKIGPNFPTWYGISAPFKPIYLGITKQKLGPLPFQFKGDVTLFGAKLPVEGIVLSERNTHVVSFVDLIKPYQVSYNIVNNQISDLLLDEIGNVILLDQNSLPKHNLMEDTGLHPFVNAYLTMKNFGMLPLDTSIRNTETPLHFQNFQKIDLSQTERILSRIQMASFFEQQALSAVGLTPQRLGQQTGQETAEGVKQSVAGSYNQTERLFVEHCDYLMPRVHEMRTNLAQFYYSLKPSFRLSVMTDKFERDMLKIQGTDLLMRDFNVFAATKTNYRATIEKMKTVLLQNPNSGATIYDYGKILQIENIKEAEELFESMRERKQSEVKSQYDHEEKMKQMELQEIAKQKQLDRDERAKHEEQTNRKDILVAQIRASSLTALKDVNENKQSDFTEYMESIQKSRQYEDMMGLKKEQLQHKKDLTAQKMDIENEKLRTLQRLKEIDLEIAKENKNRYDTPKKESNSSKEKKTKE